MSLSLNTQPYYDDYNEDNKFYRILFRPSFPIQARELTQLQSILQNQVSRIGDNLFKHGSMIIPGQIAVDLKYRYVKLKPTFASVDVDDAYLQSYLYSENGGKEIIGVTSGVRARVVNVQEKTDTDPGTLYVAYVNSGGGVNADDDNSIKTFLQNEDIKLDGDLSGSLTVIDEEKSTGIGSSASIQRGVYYVNGIMVLVESQTIILDSYTNSPSYRVGLHIDESIVTPEDDASLLDNANGSSNFAAPGAHRYKIELTLSKIALDSADDQDFIELLKISSGVIQKKITNTDYSYLEKTLARRTYDESGDYTVRPFSYEIREHRNNNRGQWLSSTSYIVGDITTNDGNAYIAELTATSGLTPPTHLLGSASDGSVRWRQTDEPSYNRGIFTSIEDGGSGDEAKLVIAMDPGKAYIQGYEIEKIATEYVVLNKARDFARINDSKIPATIGNYILITNTASFPLIEQNIKISLYNQMTSALGSSAGTLVGNTNVRGLEYESGTVGTSGAVYKLFILNTQMLSTYNFNRNVKQVYVDNGFTVKFTGDVVGSYQELSGTVSSSTTTITGVDTFFLTDLVVGDYIRIAGQDRRVTVITDNHTITIASALSAEVTSVAWSLKTITLNEVDNAKSIFKIPNKIIRNVRSIDDITVGTSYTVSRSFLATSSSGAITLSLSTPGETFASTAIPSNYSVVRKSTGVAIVPGITVNTSTNITLTGLATTADYYIIATINKASAAAKEKTKTLSSYTTLELTSQSTATANVISLEQADIYQLVKVQMKSGFTAIGGGDTLVDITDRYELDNGQRLTHYDIGSIKLKTTAAVPTGSIRISYYYFVHGFGDYFSVDSYSGIIEYKNIPNITPLNDQAFNYLDFRPKMTWDGSAKVSYFNSSDSFPEMPKRGIDIEADYSYYVGRKAKLALNPAGNFYVVDGASALTPNEPASTSLGMLLYNIELLPYTPVASSASVKVTSVNNKRYTMKDIGKLEKRITSLEYYTALNALEQDTKSLSIIDANGFDRYKNGFIVDNFSGHGIGNVFSTDYRCAVDMEKNELRPFFSMDNINIIEKNITNAQRAADGYQITGDLITLPYSNVSLISQPFASRTENVNPFAIFKWNGTVDLFPASDDWFDGARAPDLINNVDGNFNTIVAQSQEAGLLGTIWNSWQTQWSGVPVVSSTSSNYTTTGPIDGNPIDSQWSQETTHTVTLTTTATPLVQTRTGLETTVIPKIDQTVIDDRIISTALVPYIRNRNIVFTATGLKPSSRFFGYFDGTPVDTYITPATRIGITSSGTPFDFKTSAGGGSDATARSIGNDSQVCFSRGDIITGDISGATAVLVFDDTDTDGNYFIHCVNVKGSFNNNENVTGSISGATGTLIGTLVNQDAGDNLISSPNGNISGIFDIPNDNTQVFRTGIREFRLMDVALNAQNYTSLAKKQYAANGILETFRSTVVATRNGEVIVRDVSDSQNTVKTETFSSDTITGIVDTIPQVDPDPLDAPVPVDPIDPPLTSVLYPLSGTIQFIGHPTGTDFAGYSSGTVNTDSLSPDELKEVLAALRPVNTYLYTTQQLAVMKKQAELAGRTWAIWVDPLAQSFLINQSGGAFLTKLDVFFQQKDPILPVTLQIREMINGFPGPTILPFSTKTVHAVDIETSEDASVATQFTFDSPVYVKDNTEYCFVLISDSNEYNVWISQLGEKMIDSDRLISQQPYLGSMFKSQNSSSWTADQLQDIKFNLYRADFSPTSGVVTLVNSSVPYTALDANPLYVTSGSPLVRVSHPNHGLIAGSKVVISGVAADLNGVVFSSLNGTFVVSNVELDSYMYTNGTTTNATSSGPGGGTDVVASTNMRYDSLQLSGQTINFSDTSIGFFLKGTSIDNVFDTQFVPININTTQRFENSKSILSETNKTFYGLTDTLLINARLITSNSSLSPVIDIGRMSAIAVYNKVNTPVAGTLNVVTFDDRTVSSANVNIAFAAATATVSTADATTKLQFKTISVGKYVTISGAANGGNNGTFLVTYVDPNGANFGVSATSFVNESATAAVTITIKERFVSEIATVGGSSTSKYITKKIDLVNESTVLVVQYAGNIPSGSSLSLYYKIGKDDSFKLANYTLASPDDALPNTDNYDVFNDVTYTIENLTPFTSVSLKLVFNSIGSNNTAKISRVKQLRTICCP